MFSDLYQTGWVDLFLQLYPGTQTLTVDSVSIKLKELFTDNWRTRYVNRHPCLRHSLSGIFSLSIEDLRSRKNVILKEIDKAIKENNQKPLFLNRKLSLLSKEDKLEEEYEEEKTKQLQKAPEKRHYWIRMNCRYLKTVSTCGKQVFIRNEVSNQYEM